MAYFKSNPNADFTFPLRHNQDLRDRYEVNAMPAHDFDTGCHLFQHAAPQYVETMIFDQLDQGIVTFLGTVHGSETAGKLRGMNRTDFFWTRLSVKSEADLAAMLNKAAHKPESRPLGSSKRLDCFRRANAKRGDRENREVDTEEEEMFSKKEARRE